MSQTYTSTQSTTYSILDVAVVMRRVTADLVMIASSTGAVTEQKARDWAHDVELLAKGKYLRMVDLTLLSNGVEKTATQFTVNTESGEFTTSRPGGVLWPVVPSPRLRITLFYTSAYDASAAEKMRSKLRIHWVASSDDTSHATLKPTDSGRNYVSSSFGMQRKDFAS